MDSGRKTRNAARTIQVAECTGSVGTLHESINSAFAERLALLPTRKTPNPVTIDRFRDFIRYANYRDTVDDYGAQQFSS
jgi:hypothetical protein